MHHEHILPVWDFGSAGNIFYISSADSHPYCHYSYYSYYSWYW